ncbi:hypothetical protein ACM40_15955 [Chryseobacterium sp. BLS98]|uniref:hypothetical protein n=1 Tax=Chryseobacterium sp. BLS98 TaxID=885586 RepID=UPI00065B03C7|nr:hypothetical protein [Chryseobacterium sp. BLS98]KMQ59626.1 hypothetical protein ACM40_15955 [Chryseobacterium sp. BLS98]
MKKSIQIFLVLILMISCNYNETFSNREQDKQDAERVIKKFYASIKENNKESTIKLFSKKFFLITNKQQLNEMINWTNEKGGTISNYTLSNWQTLVIKGPNPKSDYSLVYYIKRDSINTQEIFSLQKENDTIKIVGYKINLDVK